MKQSSGETISVTVLLRAAIDALTWNDAGELDRLLALVDAWQLTRPFAAMESKEARSLLQVLRLLLQSTERNLRLWRRVFTARAGRGYGDAYLYQPSPIWVLRNSLRRD